MNQLFRVLSLLILICFYSTCTNGYKLSVASKAPYSNQIISRCFDQVHYKQHRTEFKSQKSKLNFSKIFNAALYASNTESSSVNSVSNINKLFVRCSWISWWFQIVLSVVSAVTLTFANTVKSGGTKQVWSSGFPLSVIGVAFAFLNSFWTFNSTRLSRRISSKKIEEVKVFPTLRYYCKISVCLSLLGMFITLIGAEQIVGNLASKILSAQGNFIPIMQTDNKGPLSSIDVFLVQATTNILVAHFASLVCYLGLQTQIPHSSHSENIKINRSDSNGEGRKSDQATADSESF